MEIILGGRAFALITAGQSLAVVAVHNTRQVDDRIGPPTARDDARIRGNWKFGLQATHASTL